MTENNYDIKTLQELDRKYVWHPFTQMAEWFDTEPLHIERGEGVYIYDVEGNKYLDAVSSLWCNVHGHKHPTIDKYIKDQLDKIGHSTYLGLAHPAASILAGKLVEITPEKLTRVFYSDSGSSAVEVAIKIAYQYQQQSGNTKRTTFAALSDAYHGDTLGSVSMGGIDLFHAVYKPLLFDVLRVPSPANYSELPINSDLPDEEIKKHPAAKALFEVFENHGEKLAGFVMEPLVQGAAGMLVHPKGYLKLARKLCDRYKVLLIVDEVATGFGRTGKMFACEHENVCPDLMAIAKGLTGGYLPVAATMAKENIFKSFLGAPEEHRAFYHGHTFTANPLGCAAALGSLEVFETERTIEQLAEIIEYFAEGIEKLKLNSHVSCIRRVGLMTAVDIIEEAKRNKNYIEKERTGHKICMEARKHGIIIRPLGDSIVFMPPLAVSKSDIDLLVSATKTSIEAVCGK